MRDDVRTVLGAIAGSRIPQAAGLAFGICLAFTLVVGVAQNVYTWSDTAPPKWIASIDVWKLGMVTGTAGTATAFLVTLYVADRNYRRGREHIPSLTIELEVVRVPASQNYDTVIVTLSARNTGTGLCRVNEVIWGLKVLSPYDDESVERMRDHFDNAPGNDLAIEFPWQPVAEEAVSMRIEIEPNETEQLTHDFIINSEISAIVASAWVANATEPKHAEGWYRRTVHINRET